MKQWLRLDQAEPFTGVFDQVPANDILYEITDHNDIVGIDDCPTDPVTVIFYNANRLDCAKFLAEAVAQELILCRHRHKHWDKRKC